MTPPVAVQLSFSAKSSGQLAQFSIDNEADLNRVLEWRWDFGDGTTSTESSPVHRYSDTGDYSVSLSWVDTAMRPASRTETISVTSYDGIDLDWELVLGEQDLSHTNIAAGPPGFVMVGELGKLLFSENGFNWCEASTHTGLNFRGVVWSQEAFWAFGSGNFSTFAPVPEIYSVLLTSLDGRNWMRVPAPPSVIAGAASNGTALVAVGSKLGTDERGDPVSRATLHVSIKGGEWQAIPTGGNGLDSVSWTGTTFIATGIVTASQISNPSKFIITSEDGIQWDTHLSSIDRVNFPTAADGARFVRLTSNIETSSDGLNWSPAQIELPEPLNAVAWGEGLFAAIGQNYVLTSADGQTWDTHPLPLALPPNSGLFFSGGVWLIPAPSGPVLWSGNGFEWMPYPVSGNPPSQRQWSVAAHSRDGFAIGALTGTVATSRDGQFWEEQTIHPDFQVLGLETIEGAIWASGTLTGTSNGVVFRQRESDWQPVFTTGQPLRDIVQFGGKVFVAGEDGKLYTASLPNGDNWQLSGEFGSIKQFQVIGGDLFILSQRQLFTSSDGTTWQSFSLPLHDAYALCRWNGVWFAAGQGQEEIRKATTLLRSDDLNTWEPIPFEIALKITHLVPGNAKLVATGSYDIGRFGIQSSQPFDVILSSQDGISWLPETSPLGKIPADLTHHQDQFIAVGNGFVWRRENL